ncbi:twin-arginine translocation signal domain-containing protein [Halosolutus gelatinilyticus]|uniref:twin-arginine translocation signal domain-containing protein n=1 Tax=Halosolutus gelatinilyticus TaxID=2931975 RepID=UPI001FF5D705|nr:twin-arginine translocation signal domain-containing protein [Halosolutus gelatinilyticus]
MGDDTDERIGNESAETNRRRFLRATGATAAAVGLPAIAAASVAARDDSNDSVTFLKGSYESPVEAAAIEETHKTIERAAARRDGRTTVARSEPAAEETGELVAYVRGRRADGVVREYHGVARSADSVDVIHKRAAQHAAALERAGALLPQGGMSQEVSTQDIDVENMDKIYENHYESAEEPFGVIGTWIDWFHRRDDDRDVNAVRQRVAMEPGWQLWDSSWRNNDGFAETDWADNEVGGEELHDWEPFGTQDGSVSKNVSVSASLSSAPSLSASVSWIYSQPALMVEDHTSFHEDRNHWFFDTNTDATETSTIGIRPGSICYANPPSCEYKKICNVKTIGTFYEDSTFHDHHETFGHGRGLLLRHC